MNMFDVRVDVPKTYFWIQKIYSCVLAFHDMLKILYSIVFEYMFWMIACITCLVHLFNRNVILKCHTLRKCRNQRDDTRINTHSCRDRFWYCARRISTLDTFRKQWLCFFFSFDELPHDLYVKTKTKKQQQSNIIKTNTNKTNTHQQITHICVFLTTTQTTTIQPSTKHKN